MRTGSATNAFNSFTVHSFNKGHWKASFLAKQNADLFHNNYFKINTCPNACPDEFFGREFIQAGISRMTCNTQVLQ